MTPKNIEKGNPPKLGMEIEANWPSYNQLPKELRTALEGSGGYSNGEHRYYDLQNRMGAIHGDGNEFHRAAPAAYHYPKGWDKGSDSGVEMRFNGPANNLEEAESLVKAAVKWLKGMNFTAFSNAGTHVHLGHLEWLDAKFGSNLNDPIRARAETLLFGYFVSRERGLWAITPAHRPTSGSCEPFFQSSSRRSAPNHQVADPRTGVYTGEILANTAPSWAFHNHLITHPYPTWGHLAGLQFGCAIQNRRKNLPTLEFRLWAGTNRETALVGYLRLLTAMFKHATTLFTEDNLRAICDGRDSGIIAHPTKYEVSNLLSEVGKNDPWLTTWVKKTVAAKGEPIDEEISIVPSESRVPQAVAAGA